MSRAEDPTVEPPETASQPLPPERRGMLGGLRSSLEWVLVVGVALVAALLVKSFVLQTFFIPSASMEHTLDEGDRVFVNKLAYDLHGVHRGDIVVFTPTPQERTVIGPGIDDLIKRVIGLPGDRIQGLNGHIYINGRPLTEPYLSPGVSPTAGRSLPVETIPAGHYFLMGDNRGDSTDSRYFGPITRSQIVGRAFVRVWPLSRLGLL